MPNWKKVVVSGSDALISHLTASGGIKGDTITGTIAGTGVVDTTQLAADAVTGAKIADDAINSEHYTNGSIDTAHIADSQITVGKMAANSVDSAQYVDGSIDTAHIANSQVTVAKMAANSIDSAQYVDGSIDAAHIASNAVTTAKINADAVTSAKIVDNAINSEHYTDGSIDTAHIANDQVTTDKIAHSLGTLGTHQFTGSFTGSITLPADSVDSAQYVNGSIDTAHYAAGSVDATALGADSVTAAKIGDNVINSEHYAADSIDAEHYAAGSVDATALASNAVTTAKINADAVTSAKIVDNAINSEHYTDGSIDTAHIANDQVTTDKIAHSLGTLGTHQFTGSFTGSVTVGNEQIVVGMMAANSIDSDQYVNGSIDAAHIASNAVTTAKINADAVTGAKIVDNAINSEHYTDGSIDTAHIANDQVTTDKIAHSLGTLGTHQFTGSFTGSITLPANSVDSAQYVDASIDNAHLANNAVGTDEIADDAVTYAKMQNLGTANRVLGATSTGAIGEVQVVVAMMAANSIDSAQYVDGSIDAAHIASNAVTTAKINADAVTGAKIVDNAINSEHYTDASIDTAHIANDQVTTDKIAHSLGTLGTHQFTGSFTGSVTVGNSQIVVGMMAANSVDSAQYVDGSIDTAHIANSQVTVAKMAANSIDSAQYVDGSIDAAHIASNAVTTAKINADAVTGAKIVDNAINSEHYTDASIDTAHIANDQVTTDKIAHSLGTLGTHQFTGSFTGSITLPADSVDSAQYVNGSIDTAHYAAGSVDATALGADSVTAAKIGDNVINSEHYAADSIDAEHYAAGSVDATALASNAVTTAKINDDAVTYAKIQNLGTANRVLGATSTGAIGEVQVVVAMMAANSVDSAQYVDGSIDADHIASNAVTSAKINADAVTGAKIADDAIDSEHYTNGSIDAAHIASNAVTTAKINADAVTTDKIAHSLGTLGTHQFTGSFTGSITLPANSVDSAQYVNGSIDTAHYAAGSVDATALGADSVTAAKIGDNVINSEHYAAASIDNEHLADDAVNSDELAAGAVDDAHLSDGVATGLAGAGTTATSGVINVIGGDGITATADDIAITAAQTTITSIFATDLKIGEDTQTAIDFETANEIHLDANNAEVVKVRAGGIEVTGQITASSGIHCKSSVSASGVIVPTGTVSGFSGSFSSVHVAADNGRLAVGAGGDLKVYHDATDTFIDNETGHLNIRNLADDKDIIFGCDDGSGGVETYFFLDGSAGSDKPITTFPDNSKLRFGNGGDLVILHDASDSKITNNVGDLIIDQSANDKDIVFKGEDGGAAITALTLDMSAAGAAAFNGQVTIPTLNMGANPHQIADGAEFADSSDNTIIEFADDAVTFSAGSTTINGIATIAKRKWARTSSTNNNLTQGDITFTGGEGTIALGDIVYMDTSGNWQKAQANSLTKSKGILGIALGNNAGVNGILLRGMFTLDHDVGNNQGIPLFLSDATAGQAIIAAPDTSGDIVRIIGYNLGNDDQIWFSPDNTFVEVA